MALIKEKGAPTKSTKGHPADSYIDLDTNKRYVCVSSYQDSFGNAEYDWRYISTVEPEIESEKIPGGDIQENKTKHTNYNKPYKK